MENRIEIPDGTQLSSTGPLVPKVLFQLHPDDLLAIMAAFVYAANAHVSAHEAVSAAGRILKAIKGES